MEETQIIVKMIKFNTYKSNKITVKKVDLIRVHFRFKLKVFENNSLGSVQDPPFRKTKVLRLLLD